MKVCEVGDCLEESFMGYNGHMVCKEHWEKHKDFLEDFDLNKEFNKPSNINKRKNNFNEGCFDCARWLGQSCKGKQNMCDKFVCLPKVSYFGLKKYKQTIKRFEKS